MAKDNFARAKEAKNDEFYTQLFDIENELKHYKEHFKGKTVFCNCDDPYESNFFKYFALNFNHLGLKKLIAVSYAGSTVAAKEVSLFEEEGEEYTITSKKAYKVTMTELKDVTGDGRVDLDDVREIIKHRIRYLKGTGSFDSEESIELLKEADIVVTNPPFSKFRDYVTQLMEYDKKFLIIGSKNAVSYKEFFLLLKENKVWIGFTNVKTFLKPDGATQTFGNIGWFTNLDISKRHEPLDLYKKYTPEEYPKFDNYDAINVEKVSDIPIDYDGIMGVPITFMDKYCPEQFEIIASSQTGCHPDDMLLKKYKEYLGFNADGSSNGRTGSTCGNNPMLTKNDGKHAYYKNANGHIVQSTFRKLFIRRKKAEE